MKKYMYLLLISFSFIFQSEAHVDLTYPEGGETFNSGELIKIEWEVVVAHNTLNWDLFFSSNGGISWNPVETDIHTDSLSYLWEVPDINTDLAQIKIVQDNEGTDYSDASQNFTISVSALINTIPEDIIFNLYPNPVTDHAIIKFNSEIHTVDNIVIYDLHGHLIRFFNNITSGELLFNRKNLSSGYYIIQLRNGNTILASLNMSII